jgi:hypothetical protein
MQTPMAKPKLFSSAMLIASILLIASVPARAQDQVISSRDGSCQVMVPASWIAGGLPGMATTKDQKVGVVISSPKYSSFATLKDNAQKAYPNDKVTKEAATEIEMEGKSNNGKPNAYRGIAAGGKFCIGEVVYETGTAGDARKILSTLKAK